MKTFAEKLKINKSPANTYLADTTAQIDSSVSPQFLDNRSGIDTLTAFHKPLKTTPQLQHLAQLDSMPSKYPAKTTYPLQTKGVGSSPVIQKTKWKHDGSTWNMVMTSSSDIDSHPLPKNGLLDDEFDQQTGVLTTPMQDALTEIGTSKGEIGFYDDRATTGYQYASGKKQQGPHTIAHISKRVAMGAAVKAGRDPLKLRGSSAFPRPRRMNKMLRDRLKTRGPNWKKETRKLRTQYLRAYKRQWADSKSGNLVKRLSALKKGIELNPATVYNIAKGQTTAAEIAGKSESRGKGAEDWGKLVETNGPITDTTDYHTFDFSGATSIEKKEALAMTASFRDLLKINHPEDDGGESESDSENEELDSDDRKLKRRK